MTRLLITGSGRSGTRWLANCVTEAGVWCGHERAFSMTEHGDNQWRAESSWLAVPYLPIEAHIVHVVRHPLQVIASRLSRKDTPAFRRHWAWAEMVEPEIQDNDILTSIAHHWARWTELAQCYADETIRLDDVRAADVERWARVVNRHARLTTLPKIDHNRAAVSVRQRLSWADVEHVPELRYLAKEVGFED